MKKNTHIDRPVAAVRTAAALGLLAAICGVAGGASASTGPSKPAASFIVTPYQDREGDVALESVQLPSGMQYRDFIFPISVENATYSGSGDAVIGTSKGTRTTSPGEALPLDEFDGTHGTVSGSDIARFETAAAAAMANQNLNHYIDIWGKCTFSMDVRFGRVIRDNDPGEDRVPELIYFERGAGGGNSCLAIEPLDTAGNPIGRAVVFTSADAIHTTPQADVNRQTMTGVAIDLSLLGVAEVEVLRFRTPRMGVDIQTDGRIWQGGETEPDFKVMAVQTVNVRLPAPFIGD